MSKKYVPKTELGTLNYRYDIYRREYKKQELKMHKQGLEMADTMMDKSTFRNYYNSVEMDLKSQVASGERKGVGNVFQYIVRNQAYNTKYTEIEALLKSGAIKGRTLDKQGFKTRSKTIMELANMPQEKLFGTPQKDDGLIDWDVIQEAYDSFTPNAQFKRASDWISYRFFGSQA